MFGLKRTTILLAASIGLGLVGGGVATAAERTAFTPAALEAAKNSGRPILVEVSAPWCPTCKAQKSALSGILSEPKYADLVVFDIDFDSQKPALKKLGVNAQSTLIVYRGPKEAGRSLGETSSSGIKSLIDKAL